MEILDILATEDGFRVSLSRAVEIEPLIMSSSTVAGMSVSRDTRPFKKRAVWNPNSFFDDSPPIRATRDGHMGCWKTRIPGSWKAYRCFHFIRDKHPVVRPRNSSLEKRQASSVIAPVSSNNVSNFLQKLKFVQFSRFYSSDDWFLLCVLFAACTWKVEVCFCRCPTFKIEIFTHRGRWRLGRRGSIAVESKFPFWQFFSFLFLKLS